MAFVTHTGNNGLLEAIHYRVPMVGLPIYMNQEDNLSRLVEKGIAVGVTKWSDADEIYHAITRVISNERSVSQQGINSLFNRVFNRVLLVLWDAQ